MKALFSALRSFVLIVIPPRLCVVGFTYAQPFLIDRAITLISAPGDEQTSEFGRGLIGATALVYMGIAVRSKADPTL